jgi:cytosine/adenosine deaminase-related metal-dependent hydrolase
VLMPGLIDTHVHTAQAMLRGCADDLALLRARHGGFRH